MKAFWDLFRDEPALVRAAVNAVIVVLLAFGVALTDTQVQAILGLVAVVVVIATGVQVRNRVTPNSRVLQSKRQSRQQ